MFGKKKVLLFLMGVLILAGAFSYKHISKSNASYKNNTSTTNNVSSKGEEVDYSTIKRDTDIKVDSSGQISINRNNKELKAMGEDTWTIFMYVTGTDLEALYEKATTDFKEMWGADFKNYNEDKVKIIIQTGGCDKWRTKGISSKKIQRYMLQYNELKLLEEKSNDSMGDEKTLYDFLNWGVSNYPAEHKGVVFWNHGTGVSQGVCCDAIHNNDTLMLSEMECAFARVSKNMTDKFELIGFDTCLSGSLEYANVLAPYGKYMVASSDVEPGDGWYYTDILNYLFRSPDATGEDLGRAIVDAYYDCYKNTEAGKMTTMAVYDLSKVDDVCIRVNTIAKNIYDGLKNNNIQYSQMAEIINKSLFYDKKNVDLGSFVKNISKELNIDLNIFNAELKNMIIYNKIGQDYVSENAIGMSMFLSIEELKLNELNVYRNAGFSPYWIRLLEYFKSKKNKIEGYMEFDWENSKYFYEDNFGYIKYEKPLISEREAYKKLKSNSEYEIEGFAEKWLVLFDVNNLMKNFFNSLLDELNLNRSYNDLSDKALVEGDNVYTNIYKKEGNILINLGVNAEVKYDDKENTYSSGFDGKWFMLADGQYLSTKVVTKNDNYIIYEAPVIIEENESTIRIKVYLKDGKMSSYVTLGVWDAPQDSSFAPRGYLPLYVGMSIVPVYESVDTSTRAVNKVYGTKYIIENGDNIQYSKMANGEFVSTLQVESSNCIQLCNNLEKVDVYNGAVINNDSMLCMN